MSYFLEANPIRRDPDLGVSVTEGPDKSGDPDGSLAVVGIEDVQIVAWA